MKLHPQWLTCSSNKKRLQTGPAIFGPGHWRQCQQNNKARYAYIAGQIHRLLKDPTTASTYFLKAKNQPKILSSSLCRNSLMQLLWHPAPMEGRKLLSANWRNFWKKTNTANSKTKYIFHWEKPFTPSMRQEPKSILWKALPPIATTPPQNRIVLLPGTNQFERKDLPHFKTYFDTTLINLPKTIRWPLFLCENMANNLSSIAKNAQTVARLDSFIGHGWALTRRTTKK